MMMMSRNWRFVVQATLHPGETVCITGSCEALGNWDTNRVIQMVPNEDLQPGGDSDCNSSMWQCDIVIPSDRSVYYRYCICTFVDPSSSSLVEEGKNVIIRRWETDITPRKISIKDDCDNSFVAQFGLISSSSRNKIPSTKIQSGWLTNETLVEFKLQGQAVKIWKRKYQNKAIFIKITPLETSKCATSGGSLGGSIDTEESIDIHSDTRHHNKIFPIVEVASLKGDECIPKLQGQFGVHYSNDEFLSFQVRVFSLPLVAFLVDFFVHDSPELINVEPAKHIGSCYLMPEQLKSTEGKVTVPILSKGFQPIGQFIANFLVVHPMKDIECDFSVTFAKHWKPNWKGLDVGHRGSGNSYTKLQSCSKIRENTIASLKHAADHGADMVEFDVQISKDLVPVIYHDFHLCTTVVHKKESDKKVLVEMPLRNLTLEQLQQLQIHNLHEKEEGLMEFSDEENLDHQAFPTLEQALDNINEDVGFNIEIKWDMERQDGSRENHNAFEINLFVDTVLKTVLCYRRTRRIVFSSFNPDICTVLRKKQNRYPVLLLTSGINNKYERYSDSRTWNVPNASNFVEMMDILGLNVLVHDIQRDPSQVELVKSKNQVLFCWTDDQNDKATVNYLKKLGIDGIIFDRLDEHYQKTEKERIFSERKDEGEDDEEEEFIRQIVTKEQRLPPPPPPPLPPPAAPSSSSRSPSNSPKQEEEVLYTPPSPPLPASPPPSTPAQQYTFAGIFSKEVSSMS